MTMDPNQLEDADRRGFNPYSYAGAVGGAAKAAREHIANLGQTVAETTGQTGNPTEAAAQGDDTGQPTEPEPGTVVGFTKRFRPDGPGYAYVAIRIKGRGWFATGTVDGTLTPTWDQLVAFADGAALWVTRDWTRLS